MSSSLLTTAHTPTKKVWSVADAFAFCEKLAAEHYENFPVASLFIPSEKRRHVAAIYALARIADDYADEPGLTPAERMESLNDWEQQLIQCYQGQAHHPVFVALRATVERFDIPMHLFRDLLIAFRSDVTTHRYASYEDLLAYCSHSANPVGRLVLLLFNYRSEATMERSDAICTALQLTNFWQDITVDLQKDRVYLPEEDMERFGYSIPELSDRKANGSFRELLSFEVQRTEELFYSGKPLLAEVGKDLSLELKLTWLGGMRILRKIRKQRYDVLTRRPALSWSDKAGILLSSLTL